MKNLILIAPPAAGKGTISKYLVETLGYTQISTGDILRKVAKEETEVGTQIRDLLKEGKLISDDIILPLFKSELISLKDKPFILDGVPRTLDQADYLKNLFNELNINNYVVINIDIDENLLEQRATGRRICKNCGTSYNIYFDGFKPKVEGTCDKCNHELIQRDDDTAETFKSRYETYLKETAPLINFYETEGVLKMVDASKSSDEIIKDVVNIVNGEEND